MATATNSTEGQILLSGDLTGTGESPQLRPTGATPGTYGSSFGAVAPDGTMPVTVPALVVDSKGRVNFIKSRTSTETLTPATSSTVGVVKVDGTTITSSGGTITATNISGIPTATNSVMGIARGDDATFYADPGGRVGIITAGPTRLGKVMPDGTTMEMVGEQLKTKNVPCTSTTLGTATGDNTTISVTAGVLSRIVPKATSSTLGTVKPDNTTIAIDGSGVISAVIASATSSTLGIVKPDNTTVTVDGSGVLSASLPTATSSTLGVVKPDNTTVTISSGVLSASLITATTSVLGVAKPDNTTITIDGSGTLNTNLPEATSSTIGFVKSSSTISSASGILSTYYRRSNAALLGFVKTGTASITNVNISSGTISVPSAIGVTLGVVRPDNTTITVNGSGVLSAVYPIATSSILGRVKVGTNINVTSGTISLATTTDTVLGVSKPDNTSITVDGSGALSFGSNTPRRDLNQTFAYIQNSSYSTYTSGNATVALGSAVGLDGNVIRIHLTGSTGITLTSPLGLPHGTAVTFIVSKTDSNPNATVKFSGMFRVWSNTTVTELLTPNSWDYNSMLTFRMVIGAGRAFVFDEQVV